MREWGLVVSDELRENRRVRASNAMAHVLPPNPEDGELEHLLIVGDEFTGLTFVGSLTSIKAIADTIYNGISNLPKDFPTLSQTSLHSQNWAGPKRSIR